MERTTERKIILITQKTRLEQLICRYNTEGMAQFYIESRGGDFSDYRAEHETYRSAVETAGQQLAQFGRVTVIDRENVPAYLFGQDDIVVAAGRDGLIANTLKYLDAQPLIGVNPDPKRWDGVLLPFTVRDLGQIMPEVLKEKRAVRSITLAQAALSDGQTLCAVNDLFIGPRTHTSAQYEIRCGGKAEVQSSSGIIVSTGLGATGWLKSILAGAAGIAHCFGRETPEIRDFSWDADYLYYTVREPYPSRTTGTEIVFGKIEAGSSMKLISMMAENGVIFSDGIEQDFLAFNAGTEAEITVSERKGQLVI
ncbi:MAG: sugar kinase [Oscillospiraceae bacterium]|nr:sugar kinase [Oscillospiraceae bacterium]